MHFGAWIPFLCGIGFLGYVLVGYPLLLYVLARWTPKQIQKADRPLTVTVILPVYNGGEWIRRKLTSIFALDYPRELMEILVVSDGSTDNTEQLVAEWEGVHFVRLPKGGKALALNKALELAKGEILFFTDVRQRLGRDCLRNLVKCFADPEVGGVCGELVILDGNTQEEASVGLYWKVEKWIRKQLNKIGTLLVVTGCVYAIRRQLAKPVPAGALGDDIFMPQAVLDQGYRMVFEEKAKAYDYPTTMGVEFWRKVRTLAALFQFVGRHGFGRHWFHFFSYKISRLLLPYAFVVVAISSLGLPEPLNYLAVALQAIFYGLAIADIWVPDKAAFKRLSSPARTFCMLMAASLWAVSVLFVPSSQMWKTTQVRAPEGRTKAVNEN